MGYEDEYITGLRNINPSEAILINNALNRTNSNSLLPTSLSSPYKSILTKQSNLDIFDDKIAALNKAK